MNGTILPMIPDILSAVATGLGFGFILAFMIGPVFFSLIQTSITHGFKLGAGLAFGIFLSDALFALLALWGVSELIKGLEIDLPLGIAGGIVMLVFGLSMFKRKKFVENVNMIRRSSIPLAVFKGFFLNALNPFVVIFWVGLIGGIGADYNYKSSQILPFIGGVLLMVLSTDLCKAWFAAKIKKYLRYNILVIVNKVTGVIFMGFGFYLVGYVLWKNFW